MESQFKKDLSNCLINFDKRILVTDLLEKYGMKYEEIDEALKEFLNTQEKTQKIKYEKRYIVHGHQDGEHIREIFKIVEESNLKEWLKQLDQSRSTLYSVEVAGGAKCPAQIFKPMCIAENVKLIERTAFKPSPCVKTSIENIPKKEISPSEVKKSANQKPVNKKGINNFFSSSTSIGKKSDDSKDVKKETKPPTPKKMQDFFKKQMEIPKTTKVAENISSIYKNDLKSTTSNTNANASIQLFDEEDDEPEEVSSDEEEKIDALKREVLMSNIEVENNENSDCEAGTSSKRRRIEDSDEEDEKPAVKQEKLDVEKINQAPKPEVETYLDEDGFVVTVKNKPKSQSVNRKPSPLKKSPAKKTSPPAKTVAAASKTKQAGIMNFFSKK